MAPKKKGKGKSKSDDGGGADGDGKKKNAPPTEVEREEMRLKITALEQKLASATARLEAQDAQATEGVALLAQKEKDHKDVMDFIKKELEKRERENASLEKKYILLREAKENEEIRLNHELDVEKATAQMAREQHDLAVSERTRLEEALEEYETLKELRRSNQAQLDTQQGELVSSRAALQQARTQLHILAAPDGDEVSDDGSCALPLLLLEAMRMYSSKPVLQEQACIALQSILSGDSKAECAAVRRHGGVELILDVMRQHEEAGELQSAACGLLWKLSVTDAPTRKLVVKDGGVQLVLAGMTRHLAHPRMQYNACGALRNLVVDNAQNFSVASQIAGARASELPPLHDAPRVRTKAMPSHRTPKARTKGGPLRPVRSLPTLRRAERAGHDEAAANLDGNMPAQMPPHVLAAQYALLQSPPCGGRVRTDAPRGMPPSYSMMPANTDGGGGDNGDPNDDEVFVRLKLAQRPAAGDRLRLELSNGKIFKWSCSTALLYRMKVSCEGPPVIARVRRVVGPDDAVVGPDLAFTQLECT